MVLYSETISREDYRLYNYIFGGMMVSGKKEKNQKKLHATGKFLVFIV